MHLSTSFDVEVFCHYFATILIRWSTWLLGSLCECPDPRRCYIRTRQLLPGRAGTLCPCTWSLFLFEQLYNNLSSVLIRANFLWSLFVCFFFFRNTLATVYNILQEHLFFKRLFIIWTPCELRVPGFQLSATSVTFPPPAILFFWSFSIQKIRYWWLIFLWWFSL